MNRNRAIIGALILLLGGCGKKNNPVTPPGADGFPPDTKFSVTLYSPSQSVAIGGTFEVSVVLYNVTNVFGVALEVAYPAASVDVLSVTSGSSFLPPSEIISVSRIEPDSGRISYAASYESASSGVSSSGSGVICKFQCKAKASGSASFVINQNTMEMKTSNGTFITGYSNILVENLSISIH